MHSDQRGGQALKNMIDNDVIINHLVFIAGDISRESCRRMNGLNANADRSDGQIWRKLAGARRYTRRLSLWQRRSLRYLFRCLFRFNSDRAMSVPAEFSRAPWCLSPRRKLVRPAYIIGIRIRIKTLDHREMPGIPGISPIPVPVTSACICALVRRAIPNMNAPKWRNGRYGSNECPRIIITISRAL